MRYIQIVRELDLKELMFTLSTMLFGKEHEHWAYYKQDAEWWRLRLDTRKN